MFGGYSPFFASSKGYSLQQCKNTPAISYSSKFKTRVIYYLYYNNHSKYKDKSTKYSCIIEHFFLKRFNWAQILRNNLSHNFSFCCSSRTVIFSYYSGTSLKMSDYLSRHLCRGKHIAEYVLENLQIDILQ